MNQMINQAYASVNQKYFKVTNHGWYIAHFDVQYTFGGKVNNVQSGTFSLGMQKKVFIPETATDVTIKISAAVGIHWTNIETKFSKTMETSCFALYGTLFTPYALEVNCAPVTDLGTGDPTPPPTPCCCNCCNCCNSCNSCNSCDSSDQSESSMSMEEYMNYLNNFYNQQNM